MDCLLEYEAASIQSPPTVAAKFYQFLLIALALL